MAHTDLAHADFDWQPLRGRFTRWLKISDAVLVLVPLIITEAKTSKPRHRVPVCSGVFRAVFRNL